MNHPAALDALSLLIDALWNSHQFLIEGKSASTKEMVIDAFREDLQVSFFPAVSSRFSDNPHS